MTVNMNVAAQAYANAVAQAQNLPQGNPAGEGKVAPGQPGDFSDMLKDVVSGAVEATKQGETKMMQGVTNEAQLVDVVTAITAAEVSLQTVVAVRDKVIEAYQHVMRMPI